MTDYGVVDFALKASGVKLRSSGEPVLYLNNPPGIDRDMRRRMLDGLQKLNSKTHQKFNDPETQTRISQYEMAFRMQAEVPELMDISKEPKHVKDLMDLTLRSLEVC